MDPDFVLQRRIFFAVRDIQLPGVAAADQLRLIKSIMEDKSIWLRGNLVNALTNDTTPLITAIKNRSFEIVRYLVDQCDSDVEFKGNVEINGVVVIGVSPLWCAVAFRDLDLVKYLLRNFADVNCAIATKSTPLRVACFDGDLPIVKHLLSNGADVKAQNRSGDTCLHVSCWKGHKEIAELFIKNGANVHHRSDNGETALHGSAKYGQLEIVKLLVEQYGATMERNIHGETPLMRAAYKGHKDVVRYLLELDRDVSGIDVEESCHRGGTALLYACYGGHYDVLKLLIEEHDADVQRRAWNGVTALHICSEKGHLSSVKLLLSHGATMCRDIEEDTPLMGAACQAHVEIVQHMLSDTSGLQLTRVERIEALELLGAALAVFKKEYRRAEQYWEQALEERSADPTNPLPKDTSPSRIPVYGNAAEFGTVKQLKALAANHYAMQLQGVLIAERILLATHYKTINGIQFLASHGFVSSSLDFVQCMALLIYSLEKLHKRTPFNLRYAKLFIKDADNLLLIFRRQIISQIKFPEFLRIMQISTEVCIRGKNVMKRKSVKAWNGSTDSGYLSIIFTVMMHLIYILIRISDRFTMEQLSQCKAEIEKFLRLDLRGEGGQTALHYAVSLDETQDTAERRKVRYFPNLATLEMLLSFQIVDINAVDYNGDTALHIASRSAAQKPNLPALPTSELSYVLKLLAAGTNVNIVNKSGHSVFQRFHNSEKVMNILVPMRHPFPILDSPDTTIILYDIRSYFDNFIARVTTNKIYPDF